MQSLQSASDITSSMQSLGASFYMSRKGGIGIGGGWVGASEGCKQHGV